MNLVFDTDILSTFGKIRRFDLILTERSDTDQGDDTIKIATSKGTETK